MPVLEFPNPANKNAVPGEHAAAALPINHDLVSSLELLLLRAKVGELTGMAWVSLDQDWASDTGWHAADPEQNATILGALYLLPSEFQRAIE